MKGRIFAAVLENNGYIVGDANARSGLFYSDGEVNGDRDWRRSGWTNIRAFGLHISNDRILMAAGNGLLESYDDGLKWRVTTDWRITEVLDVDVCPTDPSTVLIATAHGLNLSRDSCRSWDLIQTPDDWRFTQCVRFDRYKPTVAIVAAEQGILRTSDQGSSWRCVCDDFGAVRSLTQDASVEDKWWAVTANGDILVSVDGGIHWSSTGPDHSGALYCIMSSGDIVVATGYLCGAIMSQDGGQSWNTHPFPANDLSGHALVRSHRDSDTLLVGTTTDGVFSLNLNTKEWRDAGLGDATVRGLYVV